MKLTITTPDEGTTYAGYYSIEAVDADGDLVAESHLAPELLDDLADDLSDPEILRDLADMMEEPTEWSE